MLREMLRECSGEATSAALVLGNDSESRVVYFCLAGHHDGVGRVGLGPPVGICGFPSLHAGIFTAEKENFRKNHDVNPPQMDDLVLVGLESGLPCHRKDCGCRRVPPTITLVGMVPHLHPSSDFFFSFP